MRIGKIVFARSSERNLSRFQSPVRAPVARLRACQQLCSVPVWARCLFQSFFSVRRRRTRWAAFKMSFVNSELYDGIKVFSWLADLTGLPIDMVSDPLFHTRRILITARRCCKRISPVCLGQRITDVLHLTRAFYLHAVSSPKQNITWRNPCASWNRLMIHHFTS